jgi:hypothetical protein
MSEANGHSGPDPFETIESLARTVAQLAVQVTISQIQLRALGDVLEASQTVPGDAVTRATAAHAQANAGRYLAENLGNELAAMIDVADLERQIVAYLSPAH